MKRTLVAVFTALFLFFISAPVLARGGSDRTTDQQQSLAEHAIEASKESATRQAEVRSAIEQRTAAIIEDQANGQEHSQAQRAKMCEARKNGIATKVERLQTNAQRFNDRITGYLTKAQAYVTDNNLAGANIETTITAATDAQVKATAAVEALKALSPDINCTDHNVASEVAKIKAAAEQARSALKDYKQAVKAVYEAILAADNKEVTND